jgi:hypothetical protein
MHKATDDINPVIQLENEATSGHQYKTIDYDYDSPQKKSNYSPYKNRRVVLDKGYSYSNTHSNYSSVNIPRKKKQEPK